MLKTEQNAVKHDKPNKTRPMRRKPGALRAKPSLRPHNQEPPTAFKLKITSLLPPLTLAGQWHQNSPHERLSEP